jgi:hypothetical protein
MTFGKANQAKFTLEQKQCGSTATNQRASTRTVREDGENAPRTKPTKQTALLGPIPTKFVVLAILKDFRLC